MARKIRIGTSGWNYRHWKDVFYPCDLPQDEWFSHYSRSFNTVEINNTFYHQPNAKTYTAWRNQAPRGFRYAVKANRYLTHMLKLHDAADALRRFLQGARHLKAFLGPVLYQLPPNWNKDLERLQSFAELLPGDVHHVFEFRNRDWLADDTYELMRAFDLSLCVHDMLPRHPRRVKGPIVYVRFHGAGKKYGGKYRRHRLARWAKWIGEAVKDKEVFAYFNNDARGYAVENAKTFRKILRDS
jgi:uncharacterized protein YecE (DUF72 family)